ncbi:MAG: histidine phosphatase family protein [Nanoarchaeota archaeon]|nr:histidine phosphatase family protein [Nanoarchaeota archaeon]
MVKLSLHKSNKRGSMHFIRHGETSANEQNYFAGIIDVPLSTLGEKQAKEAGQNILKKGLKFDEVHTSDLIRTKKTAIIALKECGQENIPFISSPEVRERNFGVYAKNNKNLMRKTVGYKVYEENLHSPLECPESGETFKHMYKRVRKYYSNVLLPLIKAGKSLLVVCHKYIIEMFALILAGLKIDDYFDFRLPNAKPMSEKELVNYIKSESKFLKEVSDRFTFHSSWLIMAAAIFGILAKMAFDIQLNNFVFLTAITLLLGISVFFITLGLNKKAITDCLKIKKQYLIPWILKFGIAGVLFVIMKDNIASNLAIIFLMPPAFTVPTLSLLWGGGLYLAIKKTFLLSLLSPLVLAGLLCLSDISFYSLFAPFFAIMIFSMIMPTGIAQLIRIRKPIESAKFAEHWKWLGVLATISLSFISTYHFTPADILSLCLGGLENSTLFFTQGIIVFLIILLIKVFAYIVSKINKKDASETTDIYISHSTPNIFLWISCISFKADIGYIAFWSCMAFWLGILLDEFYFIYRFKKTMIPQAQIITNVHPARYNHPWLRKIVYQPALTLISFFNKS